jgi:hypothetical protein
MENSVLAQISWYTFLYRVLPALIDLQIKGPTPQAQLSRPVAPASLLLA